jgi:hypothetical protein
MPGRSSDTGSIIIETYDLQRGEYIIWTHLHYWMEGKWETKHLALQFTVV